MLGQVFELSDLARVGALAIIEIILSVDNAIVLGLLIHTLPAHKRAKALLIGLLSAFFLRAAVLCVVSYMLQATWLQIAGALYLLYLSIRHFTQKGPPLQNVQRKAFFWKTILLIELYDLAFAIDSILAGVAFIATPLPSQTGFIHPKLWIVYLGAMLGVIGIRYAANFFSRLIDRFKNLEHSAYLLVAWIGIKLLLSAVSFPLPAFIFWGVFLLILAVGFLKKSK